MNEMNDKYTIEVLKESDLALLVGGSEASYQHGLMVGSFYVVHYLDSKIIFRE